MLVSGIDGVDDTAISASSVYNYNQSSPSLARMESMTVVTPGGIAEPAAWMAGIGDRKPWIQVTTILS